MIYLFDRQKKLQKIIPKKHLLSAIQTVELNGLYQLSVEVPLFYETKEGTQYNHKKNIEKAWFAGHYDRQKRFQLYKIHARKISVKNDGTKVMIADGVHVFFDEAKAMGNIHDRRFRDTDVKAPADAAFNSIGWYIKDYDVTDRADITFYRDSVANARSLIIEKFGVEFDYGLTFDGRKIISKDLYIKKRFGRWTGKRFAYGSNLLSLSQEEDESEVYTAAVGRGKGEEIGEGHGPRIEFGDIEWSKEGITKPVGQNWIEIPSATAEYGYYEDGEIKPRIATEVIFENTENKKLIADSTYYWLLENCVPKAVWKTDVAKSGIHDLGDSGGVIYKKADIVKIARVHKMENNLLNDALSKITLGDYQHFKTDKRQQSIRAQIKRNHADNQSVITQMKNDFDARFDAQTTAIDNAYQQALIDSNANIQASEARMNVILSEQKATIEQDINQAEENAIQQATQNAETKKQEVLGSLNTFKDEHQQLYDDVTTDIIDINDFLGEKDFSLDWHLNSLRDEMQDQINAVNTANPNLIVGSSLEEVELIPWNNSIVTIKHDESINYVRVNPNGTATTLGYQFPEYVYLEQGKTYTLAVDFRSDVVNDLDYIYMMGRYSNVALTPWADKRGLTADGTWYRYYFTFDWIDTTRDARVMIGTSFGSGDIDRGYFDTRRAMLYEGSLKVPWMPSPSDNRQVITQLSREINELEDGLKSRATKTEFDLLSKNYTQFTNEFTTTAERWESELQEHDNWLNSNGSNLLQMADRVQSKVWLNDFSKVNPNLIPFANVSDEVSADMWEPWGASNINSIYVDSFGEMTMRSSSGGGATIAIKSPIFDFEAGEDYVLSAIVRTSTGWNTAGNMQYTYLINESGGPNEYLTADRFEYIDATRNRTVWKFQPTFTGKARIMLGTYRLNADQDARFSFREPKVEKGTERTPFMNAFSNVEQLANSLKLQVQELDGTFLSQSDIQIKAGYVQLGSQRLGDEEFASIFRVSPQTIDVVTEQMRLSGDLYVDGDIEALTLSAIDANFARVQTAVLTADVIDNLMIRTNAVRADHIFVDSQLVNNLWSHFIWAEKVTTASIDAIYADLRSVDSEIMTSNIIKSKWLDVDTALFNRFTADEGFIDRLTVKAGNIRDLDSIEINTYQLNMTSILNEAGKIEGGYRIRGHDGRLVINNGILQNSFDIGFIQPHFMGVDVDTSANYFRTKNTSYSTAAAFSYKRGGRYLVVEGYCEIRGNTAGASANTVGAIRLLEYSGTANRSTFVMIDSRNDNNNNNQYFKLELDLGVPQYEQRNFYVQFYVANAESDALFRINQAYQYG